MAICSSTPKHQDMCSGLAPCLYPECTNPDLHVSRIVDYPNASILNRKSWPPLLPKGVSRNVRLRGLGTIHSPFGKIVFGKSTRSGLVHLGNMHSGKRRSLYSNNLTICFAIWVPNLPKWVHQIQILFLKLNNVKYCWMQSNNGHFLVICGNFYIFSVFDNNKKIWITIYFDSTFLIEPKKCNHFDLT